MNNFLILTVTYGERFDLIQNGPLKVSEMLNQRIVIVCNGVSENYKKKLLDIAEINSNVKLIFLTKNQGSAGGFQAGLNFCRTLDFSYLIILDDDNIFSNIANIQLHKLDLSDANFCVRSGRRYISQYLKGYDPTPYIAEKDSFMGLDVYKKIKGFIQSSPQILSEDTEYNFPYAPYGGLILAKQVVKHSNIDPKKEYFVYCDDTEFTYRISKKFGLKLLKNVLVDDLNESWNITKERNLFERIFYTKENWRMFFSFRNQVNFDFNRRSNSLRFYTNVLVFVFLMTIFMIFKYRKIIDHKLKIKIIFRALVDGFTGYFNNGRIEDL